MSNSNFVVFDIHIMELFNKGKDRWVCRVSMGNGYLSTLANNVLNVNLSVALVAGEVRVVVCGTEE
jgi:hypothetical protein